MKKILLTLMAAALMPVFAMAQGCPTPTTATATVTLKRKIPGLLDGNFSVSATKKVAFAGGNLMYTKSTGKWKIMDHQYDMVETQGQNVGTDYADQDVVTLFGWATSGWDNTAADATSVHYQPYSTCNTDHSTENNNYQYGPSNANVVGSSTAASAESWSKSDSYKNYDWGVKNSSDLGSGWRTLTTQEWGYLFNSRTGDKASTVNGTANRTYTKATINTDGTPVKGIILFPDGGTFAASEFTAVGSPNTSGADFTTTCTIAQWTALEGKGCVFLPAAGGCDGTSVNDVGSYGKYWSSSAYSATHAYRLFFFSNNVDPQNNAPRYNGYSVRLVQEL